MSGKTIAKKIVSRKVTVGLGIICIILLVGLGGMIAAYSLMINDKNDMIAALNQQVANKNSEISSLSSQVANLTEIAGLTKSAIWVNFQNITIQAGYEIGWNASANYSGYVSVQVFSSTPGDIYVRVTYSSHGVNYDNKIDVGMGGTAVFPVLPASVIQIIVGNPGAVAATKTIDITYYY